MKRVVPVEGGDAYHGSPIVKALSLLESLVEADKPVALTDLAVALGLPKPTVHRIALLLEREGYIRREPGSRRFIAGSRLISLAVESLGASVEQGMSHVILKDLSEAVDEACELGVLVGGEVSLIDQVQPDRGLTLRYGPGERVPAHCTAIGKMALSLLPRRRRERLIGNLPLKRFTENTITDAETIIGEVERARAAGVATASNEFLAGVVGVAVPVMGPRQRGCAALALVAPEARLTLEQALEHLPRLRAAADRLSAALFAGQSDGEVPDRAAVSLKSA